MGDALQEFRSYSPERVAELEARPTESWRQLKWKAHQERGLEDFWYFNTAVLQNRVLYEPLHRPMCEMYQRGTKSKQLYLLHRGGIKSNVVTIAGGLWEMAKNPNVRILDYSHKADIAWGFCGRTLSYLKDEHSMLRKTYPYLRPPLRTRGSTGQWSKKAVTIQRSQDHVEATVETAGTDTSMVSRHYDIIYFDDMVTDKSVASSALIQNTLECYEAAQAFLEPGGRVYVVGTRWDYGDLYGHIIERQSADFDLFIKGCRDENGEPLFPTRFTNEDLTEEEERAVKKISLTRLRRSMGSYLFSCLYDSEPLDPDTQLFHESDFQEIAELPDRPLKFLQVSDLSSEQATDSYTAIETWALDEESGDLILYDIFWGQFSPSETIDELIRWQLGSLRPDPVGFEKGPYERSILPGLRSRCQQLDLRFPYVFLDPAQAQRPKEDRIRGFQPLVEEGRIKIYAGCRHKHLFVEEFIRFPRFWRNDLADAAAQIPFIVRLPERRKVAKPEPLPKIEPSPFTFHMGRVFEDVIGRSARADALGADRVRPKYYSVGGR